MCIVQLPPGGNPLAVNKYVISFVGERNLNVIKNARYNNKKIIEAS